MRIISVILRSYYLLFLALLFLVTQTPSVKAECVVSEISTRQVDQLIQLLRAHPSMATTGEIDMNALPAAGTPITPELVQSLCTTTGPLSHSHILRLRYNHGAEFRRLRAEGHLRESDVQALFNRTSPLFISLRERSECWGPRLPRAAATTPTTALVGTAIPLPAATGSESTRHCEGRAGATPIDATAVHTAVSRYVDADFRINAGYRRYAGTTWLSQYITSTAPRSSRDVRDLQNILNLELARINANFSTGMGAFCASSGMSAIVGEASNSVERREQCASFMSDHLLSNTSVSTPDANLDALLASDEFQRLRESQVRRYLIENRLKHLELWQLEGATNATTAATAGRQRDALAALASRVRTYPVDAAQSMLAAVDLAWGHVNTAIEECIANRVTTPAEAPAMCNADGSGDCNAGSAATEVLESH